MPDDGDRWILELVDQLLKQSREAPSHRKKLSLMETALDLIADIAETQTRVLTIREFQERWR